MSLYEAVEATGVSLKKFRLYLLGLSAFESDHEDEQPILLDEVNDQIKKADSINDIFEVLTTECCSFIGIFQSIIESKQILMKICSILSISRFTLRIIRYLSLS